MGAEMGNESRSASELVSHNLGNADSFCPCVSGFSDLVVGVFQDGQTESMKQERGYGVADDCFELYQQDLLTVGCVS